MTIPVTGFDATFETFRLKPLAGVVRVDAGPGDADLQIRWH